MALMDYRTLVTPVSGSSQQNHAGSLRVLARDPFHDATDDLRTLTKPVGFEVVSTADSDPHHCRSHADSLAKRPDLPLTWPCHSEGISRSEGPRQPPVPPETPSVGQGELTPSSSFTQLGGMWMRDVDLGAKVGPGARAPWGGFGAASECQDRHRPDNAWRRRHHAPSGETAQTNSPRFLLR
jgi:hypothetical protein